jgi:hypothetical protein
MYRIIADLARTGEIDDLLGRLRVFTQDALAPMRMNNGFSFVRDFERLLGPAFFEKVKSFAPMLSETDDIEGELFRYLEKLESPGGMDIFLLAPTPTRIIEHHIDKFRVGGSVVSERDEVECRNATHILTLGPAAILCAKKIVQSIVDASTAPAKRVSFARLVSTDISTDAETRAKQLDENPGLWIRLHPDVTSFVLPDLL